LSKTGLSMPSSCSRSGAKDSKDQPSEGGRLPAPPTTGAGGRGLPRAARSCTTEAGRPYKGQL
jgi:hypothetical protein